MTHLRDDDVLGQRFHEQAPMQQPRLAPDLSAPMVDPSGPICFPCTSSTSALAKVGIRERQRTAAAPIGKQDPGGKSEPGDSRMADIKVVDRLIFLWTTVKPW